MNILRRRRQLMKMKEPVIEEIEITWSGTGTEKTASPVIDATYGEVYYSLPFIPGDSRLASGASESSQYAAFCADLYVDAECTQLAGYYYFDTESITSSIKTWANTPAAIFGQRFKAVPKGYYAVLKCNRRSGVFVNNSSVTRYLNTYGNKVERVT